MYSGPIQSRWNSKIQRLWANHNIRRIYSAQCAVLPDWAGSRTLQQCCQFSDFVTRFSDFSDPPNDFFPKKRLATNLVTFWTNLSESLWLRVSRWYYRTRARSCFHSARTPPSLSLSLSLSLALLYSVSGFSPKRVWGAISVKIDVASLILHANTAEHTAHKLSLSFAYVMCIWFHQTTAWL